MAARRQPNAANDKRRRILDAAVRVFARKGYHGCRVSDIAKEARIAYGLVYHYFSGKEEVLNTIFREQWQTFLGLLRSLESEEGKIEEKLVTVVSFLLNSYSTRPDLMEVLILEIARSSKFLEASHIDVINQAFAAIERMIRKAQRGGELRGDVDARIASYVFLGGIEMILTGFVLNSVKKADPDYHREVAETVVDTFLYGLSPKGIRVRPPMLARS